MIENLIQNLIAISLGAMLFFSKMTLCQRLDLEWVMGCYQQRVFFLHRRPVFFFYRSTPE